MGARTARSTTRPTPPSSLAQLFSRARLSGLLRVIKLERRLGYNSVIGQSDGDVDLTFQQASNFACARWTGLWNRTGPREQDYVIKYDLRTDKIVRLKTPNYNDDIVTHGMGLFVPSPESDTIYIHLVNHKKHPQSCISIFSHKLGTDTMEHLEDNCDRLIVEPNDVAPTGPRSFYVTNVGFDSGGTSACLDILGCELISI